MPSDKATATSFGRDFWGFPAIANVLCGLAQIGHLASRVTRLCHVSAALQHRTNGRWGLG